MTRYRFVTLFLALLAISTQAGAADPLAELRAKLTTLRSDQAVRATISIKTISSSNDDGEAKQRTRDASVSAELGAKGLELGWTRQQIEGARQAARKKVANPDATTQAGGGLDLLDAEKAAEILDYAEPLRLELEGAKLIADRMENRGGKPTRVVVVEPRLALSASERKSLKSGSDELKIWLDADGFPIATERKADYKFSRFLISFEVKSQESRSLTRLGGRLVVTQSSSEETGSGLGRTGKTLETIRVVALN